jgi:hypothetical protein
VVGTVQGAGYRPVAVGSRHDGGVPSELEVVETPGAVASDPRSSGRRFDPKLAVASLAIAVGLVLVGFALRRGVTGDDVTKLPAAIEAITPVPDAVQVPSQTEVVVDLADGYTGELRIDGTAYETLDRSELLAAEPDPGTQIDIPAGVVFDPGSNTLTFHAGDEVGFDEFGEGNHQVTVIYWKLVDGPGSGARSYHWTFNVV